MIFSSKDRCAQSFRGGGYVLIVAYIDDVWGNKALHYVLILNPIVSARKTGELANTCRKAPIEVPRYTRSRDSGDR